MEFFPGKINSDFAMKTTDNNGSNDDIRNIVHIKNTIICNLNRKIVDNLKTIILGDTFSFCMIKNS